MLEGGIVGGAVNKAGGGVLRGQREGKGTGMCGCEGSWETLWTRLEVSRDQSVQRAGLPVNTMHGSARVVCKCRLPFCFGVAFAYRRRAVPVSLPRSVRQGVHHRLPA